MRNSVILAYVFEPVLALAAFFLLWTIGGAETISRRVEQQSGALMTIVGGCLATSTSRYLYEDNQKSKFRNWLKAQGVGTVFSKAWCSTTFIHATAFVSLLVEILLPNDFTNFVAGFMTTYAVIAWITLINNIRLFRRLEAAMEDDDDVLQDSTPK